MFPLTGRGLVTRVHALPFQCTIMILLPAWPTAQASREEIAATTVPPGESGQAADVVEVAMAEQYGAHAGQVEAEPAGW